MEKPTLAEARKQRGVSANELARQAGVAASTIRRIEHGDPPHMKTINKIAQALACAPETIDCPAIPLAWGPGVRLPRHASRLGKGMIVVGIVEARDPRRRLVATRHRGRGA
jgi:transcriptional regulator with XRE-family HTH domain